MGTTPKGLPYPENTDKLGQGDDAIKALAFAVDGLVDDVTPISAGGTGATTAPNARANLGVLSSSEVVRSGNSGINTLEMQWSGGRMNIKVDGSNQGQIATVSDVLGRVDKNGDTIGENLQVNGAIFVPNAYGATAGYTVAYINNDGRISRGTSSERFKENIEDAEIPDVFAVALAEFEWIGGDGSRHFGYIAERLAEHPDLARFVIFDEEDRPQAIEPIELLMAQVAALNARVEQLERER